MAEEKVTKVAEKYEDQEVTFALTRKPGKAEVTVSGKVKGSGKHGADFSKTLGKTYPVRMVPADLADPATLIAAMDTIDERMGADFATWAAQQLLKTPRKVGSQKRKSAPAKKTAPKKKGAAKARAAAPALDALNATQDEEKTVTPVAKAEASAPVSEPVVEETPAPEAKAEAPAPVSQTPAETVVPEAVEEAATETPPAETAATTTPTPPPNFFDTI